MTAPFTIFLMQSAHTDIGYTHPQEQIAAMYLDHYDRVLELCRQTASAPAAQRFKWTCETSWQVRHYLTHRPERTEEFVHYVRQGQIELTAAYLHFADNIDADAYRQSLGWIVDFARRHAVPLKCALHCDINGWPWAMADILHDLDIPYFCSQTHIDSASDPLGARGSVHYHWTMESRDLRPDVPVRIPQAFWWQGPHGGKVLHWLGEHYLMGNVLGLASPQGFSRDKTRYFMETDTQTTDDLFTRTNRELPRYLDRLRAGGYPYDALLISTGGYYVDNAAPSDRSLDLIARWNATHTDVQLRSATLSEWFAYLETQTGQRPHWPTYQVAWPDCWAHGLGSVTARVAQERRTQRRRAAVTALVQQAQSPAATQALDNALENEIYALEHTFDAWCTTARPTAPVNEFQLAVKLLRFHRAELYLDEAAGFALRALAPAAPTASLYVPPAQGTRLVAFDAGDQKLDPTTQHLVDAAGEHYPFQWDQADLSRAVATLPGTPASRDALGTAYRLVTMPPAVDAAPEAEDASATSTLRTAAWEISLDPTTGALRSMRDRQHDHEWVGAHPHGGFGQLVHEAVVHPLGRKAVGNARRLLDLDDLTAEGRERWATLYESPAVEHTSMTALSAPRLTRGPIFDALEVTGQTPRLGQVRQAWRLYHDLPIVELVLDWEKTWSDLPEAAYVAFPFTGEHPQVRFETGGGFFTPGSQAARGQLPGTCSRYYTIQRAAAVTTAASSLYWLPLDAPLVMTNAIDYNNWESTPWQWNGFLASMPVNHYWDTNFPTSERGPIRLRYRFISAAVADDAEGALSTALPLDALGWR